MNSAVVLKIMTLIAWSSASWANAMVCHDVHSSYLELRKNQAAESETRHGKTYEEIREYLTGLQKENPFYKEVIIGLKKTKMQLALVDKSFGEETVIIKRIQGKEDQELFSNKIFGNVTRHSITKMHPSPDEKFIALSVAKDGSTDQRLLTIISASTGKILSSVQADRKNVYWHRNRIFYYKNNQIHSSSVDGIIRLETKIKSFSESRDHGFLVSRSDGKYLLLEDREILIPAGVDVSNAEVISSSTEKILIRYASSKQASSVLILKREPSKPWQSKKIMTDDSSVILDVFEAREKIFAIKVSGPKQSIEVYREDLSLETSLSVPSYVSVRKIQEGADGSVAVWAYSPIRAVQVELDLAKQKFSSSFKHALRDEDGNSYTVKPYQFADSDGVVQNYQVVKKSDTRKVKGAFIQAYGGFNSQGYYYPRTISKLGKAFLDAGGTFVLPMIRGDVELGAGAGKSARFFEKMNTFRDLDAIAVHAKNELSISSQQVILTGTSNGGLTTAATGLLYPQHFGLLIPVNGVLDVLSKESLDGRFNDGWSNEYGDSRKTEFRTYMTQYSPVELTKQNQRLPKFLILNGRDDTRVNPEHSFRLHQALVENHPDQANDFELFSINNTGHWQARYDYQNLMSWRSEIILWTSVFNHLELSLNP